MTAPTGPAPGRREPRPCTAPVRGAARIRQAPAAAPAGERCEMCGAPVGDAHSHVVDIASRALLCTCRAVRAAVRLPGRGRLALQGGAGPLPPAGADCRCRSGTTCRSRSAWRSSSATPRSAGSSASTRARPARPSRELPLGAWDAVVAAEPGAGRPRPGRGGAAGPGRRGAAVDAYLVPIDVCYELVGQLRRLWRGFDGGAGVRRPAGGRSSTRSGGRGAGDRARLHRPGRPAGAARGRAGAAVPAPDRPSRPARPCTRSRCGPDPDRARSAAGTRPTEADGLTDLFGDADALGAARCGRSSGRTPSTMVPGFTGVDRVRPAGALHLRLRGGRGQVPARAGRRRGAAAAAASAGRCSPAAAPGSRCEQVPWHLEAPYRLPVAVWRDADGPLLPRRRLDPAGPRHPRRAGPLPGRARPDELGRRGRASCWPAPPR